MSSYIPADDAGVEAATPKLLEGAEWPVLMQKNTSDDQYFKRH